MCTPKHILREIVFHKKYRHIDPDALRKGVGMRTILERGGWLAKKEDWTKITGCQTYYTCHVCNARDHMY